MLSTMETEKHLRPKLRFLFNRERKKNGEASALSPDFNRPKNQFELFKFGCKVSKMLKNGL